MPLTFVSAIRAGEKVIGEIWRYDNLLNNNLPIYFYYGNFYHGNIKPPEWRSGEMTFPAEIQKDLNDLRDRVLSCGRV